MKSPASIGLDIRNVSKRYNNRWVLKGITCSLKQGDVVVVTGPNGSGKSTLLKIIAGLLRPTQGTIACQIHGKEVSPGELVRQIGYVSPELGLYERLTARENLEFFASLRGLDIWQPDLLEKVGLKDCKTLVYQFSTGMRQRLKIAWALIHNPSILILDEPSSNLDSQGIEILDAIIQTQLETGIVIIASNNREEVAKYGKQVIAL